jgi:hypothetical protein
MEIQILTLFYSLLLDNQLKPKYKYYMNSNTTARVKDRLRAILKQRGVKGLSGLLRAFKDADLSKNGLLSWEEFCTLVNK